MAWLLAPPGRDRDKSPGDLPRSPTPSPEPTPNLGAGESAQQGVLEDPLELETTLDRETLAMINPSPTSHPTAPSCFGLPSPLKVEHDLPWVERLEISFDLESDLAQEESGSRQENFFESGSDSEVEVEIEDWLQATGTSSSFIEILPPPPETHTDSVAGVTSHYGPKPLPTHRPLVNGIVAPVQLVALPHRLSDRRKTNRISSSFISLLSPLGPPTSSADQHQRSATSVEKDPTDPALYLRRSLSSPLPRTSISLTSHNPQTHRRRDHTMSVIMPGQSSIEFGDESVTSGSAWKGLRRALSMGSSAGSGSASKRSTFRLSRQSGTPSTTYQQLGQYFDRQYGTDRGNGWDVDEKAHDGMDRMADERHRRRSSQVGLITSNRSLPPSRSELGSGSGSASTSRSTLSRDREQEAPSGPSSPCDTDRFSISDWSNIPFPKPPSIEHQMPIELEPKGDLDPELVTAIEPPVKPPTQAIIPSHADESPTDPQFSFNRPINERHGQPPSLVNSKRIAPLSVSASYAKVNNAQGCPPSPLLTPSPQESTFGSPILTTPAVQPSSIRSEAGKDQREVARPQTTRPLVPTRSGSRPPPLSDRTSIQSTIPPASIRPNLPPPSASPPNRHNGAAHYDTNHDGRTKDYHAVYREAGTLDNPIVFKPGTGAMSAEVSESRAKETAWDYDALGHSTLLPQQDTLSPLNSFTNFSSSPSSSSGNRRDSKNTVSSGNSSIYSYSTGESSSRARQWQYLGEKPDISTVFEEQSLESRANGQSDYESLRESSHIDDIGIDHRLRQLSDSGTLPGLHAQPSLDTLVNRGASRSKAGYFLRDRASTINSATGTTVSDHSTKSGKQNHPFANAVVIPTASLSSSKSQNFLSPQQAQRADISSLSNSRSSPNLADTYGMTQSQPHQVTLVSTEDDKDDEDTCPVCVESLSFTYRLPGEKPHIVPHCGHALHEECFVTVYGNVPPEGSKKVLGVCGVCRQPMKMADGATKRDKLAVLMGQPGQNGPRKPSSSVSARSTSGLGTNPSPEPSDLTADDPVEDRATGASRSMQASTSQPKVVVPSISIRSEFPSITKGYRKGKQVVTAMITVEVPPMTVAERYPAQPRPGNGVTQEPLLPNLPPSPRSGSNLSLVGKASAPDPFAHVVTDLRHRMTDYKTSGIDQLGSLRLFDLLSVRKAQLIREFHVYLFQEALICVSEEKKSGLRGIFSSSSSVRSDHSGGSSQRGRGVLKLKGRIYVRHIKDIVDSSTSAELSLTITMHDPSLDSFILCFKDRSSHKTWRATVARLLAEIDGGKGESDVLQSRGTKAQRMLGAGTTPNGTSALGVSFGDLASPVTAGFPDTPPGQGAPAGDLAYDQPLAPVHTPVDLVIVISLPTSSPATQQQLPLKVKLMRSSLSFVLALMGPKDRVSLVTCEMGTNGLVRKTPFLSPHRYESRRRLEGFIDIIGSGRTTDIKDDFEVSVGREERFDVVTAVNVGLDVVLQRKVKNPTSGMVLISDTSDAIKRAQMDLVTARLDAANMPVHALGYGRSHDPSPLWLISNHTHGTYTFVKEWYHLRDSLAGVVGGLLTMAVDNMKLHLTCRDNDFHVIKVSGTTSAILSKNGKDVDIELRELRHGDIREILVELDMEGANGEGSGGNSGPSSPNRDGRFSHAGSSDSGFANGRSSTRRDGHDSNGRYDTSSVGDVNALQDGAYQDTLIDEVPVVEVDCSFHDPGAGRSVARLAHPVLLTVAVLPSMSPSSSVAADPLIIRRRMELLAADMITRALLIASRKNFTHASRMLRETKSIIETIVDGLNGHLRPDNGHGKLGRSKREAQTAFAVDGLLGVVMDLDLLLDGLEEHKELFERDHRNYSAQQAGVLRSQKSWTTRTPTERTYATKDVQRMIQLSGAWQGGRA
ncbi:hypothetical protein IAU60_006117 [Kwoniella sp. DSM 27419]